MKKYIEPELNIVNIQDEDVLTKSILEDESSDWETPSSQEGGGTVPIIGL